MDLTPADRLQIHLTLHYPGVKLKHVRLSDTPGFLELSPFGRIDIRGASYATNGNSPLRLWDELHGHFAHHVEVIKRKNGLPTLIEWNGMVYHLDQSRSFNAAVYRRNERKRARQSRKESG